jgi:hypothetical protein
MEKKATKVGVQEQKRKWMRERTATKTSEQIGSEIEAEDKEENGQKSDAAM